MTYLAKPKPGRKRNEKEIKEFFSKKMAILSKACASKDVTPQEFRVLFALIIEHLSNGTDWCNPTDETLGLSCATGRRSVGTHTRGLKAKGWITKRQTLHAPEYGFPHLTSYQQDSADMHVKARCGASP